jgi:RimJ/RimL family protein N-acetyltransferase
MLSTAPPAACWDLRVCRLRPLRREDADSLAHHGNNHQVWRNLRDRFPHPLTVPDVRHFLELCVEQNPPAHFAIEIEGRAVGVIGLTLGEGERRICAELGYWLGQPYWGRGITTAAVQTVTAYALQQFGLVRVEAYVFASNPASARVLEKCGFQREGVLRSSVIKEGVILDRWLYAFVVDDPPLNPGVPA